MLPHLGAPAPVAHVVQMLVRVPLYPVVRDSYSTCE